VKVVNSSTPPTSTFRTSAWWSANKGKKIKKLPHTREKKMKSAKTHEVSLDTANKLEYNV